MLIPFLGVLKHLAVGCVTDVSKELLPPFSRSKLYEEKCCISSRAPGPTGGGEVVSARPRPMSMVDTELAHLSIPGPRHCRKSTASEVNNFSCVQVHVTHFGGLLQRENQLRLNLSELKNTQTPLD